MLKISQTLSFEEFNVNKKINSDLIILKTSFDCPFNLKRWNSLISLLPVDLKNEVQSYQRWQDRCSSLLGKLLIYYGYGLLNGEKLDFQRYKRDRYNKPFIQNSLFSFNISHSIKSVVCAVSKDNLQLGIDIEKIREIDINCFNTIFHQNEQDNLLYSDDKVKEFYKIWTRKEAFVKAKGSGIVISLDGFDTTKDIIYDDKQKYYLESYLIENYYCSLVSNKMQKSIVCFDVVF